MADATLAFLEARDLGRLEHRIALRGKILIAGKSRAPDPLCRTSRGLYLVHVKNSDSGASIDLMTRSDLRYERGKFGDRMVLNDAELVVPANHRKEARLAIGLARLGREGKSYAHRVRPSRFV